MAYDINGIDGSTKGAVDLNLLIAPMYAFLYAEREIPTARSRGCPFLGGSPQGVPQ